MAQVDNIYIVCPKCKGVGEVQEGVEKNEQGEVISVSMVTCPVCNGDKELYFGQVKKEKE